MELTATQTTAVQSQTNAFLLGASGSGKTTALQQRVLHLLESGEPAYTILVLVAEPEHKQAYVNAVHQSGLGPYADLNITSYNSMAMNMVKLSSQQIVNTVIKVLREGRISKSLMML